jgi:acyl-CoA reductase-like NAD-dependent aldehyde dehydrogenase
MNTVATTRAFDQAYINGEFVAPHGREIADLTNPTNNQVIGKVTMADQIDTRRAIAAAKEAFKTFSQTSREERMEYLQRLHDSVSKRMEALVRATVLEYGAPQQRAKAFESEFLKGTSARTLLTKYLGKRKTHVVSSAFLVNYRLRSSTCMR